MDPFVTVYNYAGFRLISTPYELSDTQISLIFPVNPFGMAAPSAAGALFDRVGRGPVLIAGIAIAGIGLGLTLLRAMQA
jgi:YNFM family putative membrane transporter